MIDLAEVAGSLKKVFHNKPDPVRVEYPNYLWPMNPIVRFLLIYLAFVAFAATAYWFYNQVVDPQYTHRDGWISFGIFSGVTGLVHLFLLRAAAKDPKAFVRGFIFANTIKIFIYLGFLVIFVLFVKVNATVFIAQFAVFYFVFTAFEVSLLYNQLRPGKKG